jgi:mannosyltransferase OCH1-like enzyme
MTPQLSGAIPKLLHLTCEDPKELNQELRANIEKMSATNPDWSVRVYGNIEREQFISKNFDVSTLRRYRQINAKYGAARADFFRYLCLYKLGGAYLDIKSSTTIALSKVIRPDDRFLISQWHNSPDPLCRAWGQHHELAHIPGGEYMQWMIFTCAGHPYLKNVIAMVSRNIDRYHAFYHGVGRGAVLAITGPIAYTLAIHPILNAHPHRFVDAFSDMGLQYSIYSDRRAHRQLQARHYSSIDEPLVLRDRISDVLVFGRETLFRILHSAYLRRRFRSIFPRPSDRT